MAQISLIIPVYNVEKYLRRCLDSVLNQTFQDWQAICVDDGSPDNSGKILDEYAARDKRFVVIHKENGGVSTARNVALKKVKTPYVMYLDGDDCFHPQTLEIVYGLAKKYDPDIVSFKYRHSGTSANVPLWFNDRYNIDKIKTLVTDNLLKYATNHDKGTDSWYVQQCMMWQHLYKYDLIKNISLKQEIFVLEDVVFWSNVLFSNPKTVITKVPLYAYTDNAKSILHTSNHKKSCKNLILAVKHSYLDMLKQNVSWINRRRWKARFMWDILSRVYVYAKKIDDKDELQIIKSRLIDLKNIGVFDNLPDCHAWRYKRRIEKLISQIS